jgi:hypothetical protein
VRLPSPSVTRKQRQVGRLYLLLDSLIFSYNQLECWRVQVVEGLVNE